VQTGDVLLLEAHSTFAKTFDGDDSFALVSVIAGATPTKWNRSLLALFLVIAMVIGQVRPVHLRAVQCRQCFQELVCRTS
jgi:hypothetical protein